MRLLRRRELFELLGGDCGKRRDAREHRLTLLLQLRHLRRLCVQ